MLLRRFKIAGLFFAMYLFPSHLLARLPRVLMHYSGTTFGGVANDILVRHQQFLKHGLTSILLVHKGSRIIEKLDESALSYKVVSNVGQDKKTKIFTVMYEACKKHNINTIFCASNDFIQLYAAKKVKELFDVRIVYVEHSQIDALTHYGTKQYKNTQHKIPGSLHAVLESTEGFDAFIGVNERITNAVAKYNKLNPVVKNQIRHFATIKPFLNESKFLQFYTNEMRQQYFKRAHNIDIANDVPVITMMAGFYLQKRQDVLVTAFNRIKNSTNAHLVLVGGGSKQDVIKQLVSRLELSTRVHLLGFVDDTEAVLYHSDMHVLSSRTETVGLATVEACLMKKPVIGTAGTGSDYIIVNGETGYLFKNGDSADLSDKILALLNAPGRGKVMGVAGYTLMQTLFGADTIYNQTVALLTKILN